MALFSRMCSQDAGSSLAEFALVLAGFLLASSVVGLIIGICFGFIAITLKALAAKRNGDRITVTHACVSQEDEMNVRL